MNMIKFDDAAFRREGGGWKGEKKGIKGGKGAGRRFKSSKKRTKVLLNVLKTLHRWSWSPEFQVGLIISIQVYDIVSKF